MVERGTLVLSFVPINSESVNQAVTVGAWDKVVHSNLTGQWSPLPPQRIFLYLHRFFNKLFVNNNNNNNNNSCKNNLLLI